MISYLEGARRVGFVVGCIFLLVWTGQLILLGFTEDSLLVGLFHTAFNQLYGFSMKTTKIFCYSFSGNLFFRIIIRF